MGPPDTSSIPASLGTSNVSILTVAKSDQDFGRPWEQGVEGKHNAESPRKPRKLVFFADGSLTDANRPRKIGDEKIAYSGEPSLYERAKINDFYVLPTDVYHLAKAVKPTYQDPSGKTWNQEIHYQHGIGADQGRYWANQAGMVFGFGAGERIRDGYSWLSNRYQDGDDIFLVGFSRGAFIARSVGGMISRYGLMKKSGEIAKEDSDLVKLYEAYKKKQVAAPDGVNITGKDSVPIKAISVWETVGSLGLPDNNILMRMVGNFVQPFVTTDYSIFHDTSLDNNIKNAFHVLALTDHKMPFPPCLWEKPDGINTNLEQVWFPGQHEDVGGGFEDDHGVAFSTLAWFMDKLDPMLGLNMEYFESQVKILLQYYKTKGDYRKWGEGRTTDTQRMSLFYSIILQRSSRSPGWYYKRNPQNGDETSEYLENTNEKIHRTARLRNGKPNRGADDNGPFQPTSLNKYSSSEQTPGHWVWTWNGWGGTKILPEAEIGAKYEPKLQSMLETAYQTPKTEPDTSVSWLKVVANTFAFRA